nr:MAG TPA: hypothetical protein [Caudoviricetes sp.]
MQRALLVLTPLTRIDKISSGESHTTIILT